MKKLFLLPIFCFVLACAQHNWVGTARIIDFHDYYMKLMEQTVHEIEKMDWSNMKLQNILQNISVRLYNRLVTGVVLYFNGFLVSVQKVQVLNPIGRVSTRTVNGEVHNIARIEGTLALRDVDVGFDVMANITENEVHDVHRFTGIFNHTNILFVSFIEKDLNTGEMTTGSSVNSLLVGLVRMRYSPRTNLTEVLSRTFIGGNNMQSFQTWGRTIIAPFMLKLATETLGFPEICFGC